MIGRKTRRTNALQNVRENLTATHKPIKSLFGTVLRLLGVVETSSTEMRVKRIKSNEVKYLYQLETIGTAASLKLTKSDKNKS